jgi:hypothetical protein
MHRFESIERELVVLCLLGMAIAGCASGGAGAPVAPVTEPAVLAEAGTESASSADPRLERRITLQSLPDQSGLDAREVLRVIGDSVFGGQLEISPGFQGLFHVDVSDRPIHEVLDVICRETKCSWGVTDLGTLKITLLPG